MYDSEFNGLHYLPAVHLIGPWHSLALLNFLSKELTGTTCFSQIFQTQMWYF